MGMFAVDAEKQTRPWCLSSVGNNQNARFAGPPSLRDVVRRKWYDITTWICFSLEFELVTSVRKEF
jgi:hypothetical protein